MVISDLTYVRIGTNWNDICELIALFTVKSSATAPKKTNMPLWLTRLLLGSIQVLAISEYSILIEAMSSKTNYLMIFWRILVSNAH